MWFIEDSVVQRTNIVSWNKTAKKEREDAQKQEREERERLRRQKEQEERELREEKAREDAERRETPGADQKTVANSIGMEFVFIPNGEFDMGSPSNEKDRYSHERPVHRVKISKAFYMGKYEVTQKQWREVMGSNPSYFNGDNLPVETVSWDDVQKFIKKLNEREGTNKYRLPSEAEWEYAARAGTTTRYSFGDDESKLGDYAWYHANSGNKSHEVGQKMPNPWGLYDMHGNVWEWVQDKWHDNYKGAPTNGSAWESGSSSKRISRGGGWFSRAWLLCSADRTSNNDPSCRRDPSDRDDDLGFRLLRIS
jgi:formylglycine-generating enzyme required for sulfatase activity